MLVLLIKLITPPLAEQPGYTRSVISCLLTEILSLACILPTMLMQEEMLVLKLPSRPCSTPPPIP